ncbi:hypothetical protein DES36_1255 [Alkalibaculum bacchi]|uniref:Uncharacterized protein n=1 Tax=Alkalibaculum bacchi TaxID=645887 RepID=A0A366HXJ6_9FIRM|nr:hypothetical protein DES36_1255 [Alkalibaculum bacchi]
MRWSGGEVVRWSAKALLAFGRGRERQDPSAKAFRMTFALRAINNLELRIKKLSDGT